MSRNLSELAARGGLTKNLFERMGELAEKTGTPDKEGLEELAQEFLIGNSSTYGAATFYDFLKPENAGKKAYVCNGSACLLAGTQDKVQSELEKHLDKSEIGHMCCLGRCHENSAFNYGGKNYSAKGEAEIAEILSGNTSGNPDKYEVVCHGKRVLTADFPGLEAYYGILKDMLAKGKSWVLEEVKTSGIRGRGGAGFPMGFKWESCGNMDSHEKFIVCNADEGDPGAYSDRYLLEEQPHSVLFGMMAGGYAIGAQWGVVYIRGEYPEAIEIVENAIQDLHKAGFLGENILGSGFDFNFKVIAAKGSYICGEETALLSSIEGQRPEVRIRPPYPTQEGLFNRPTVVNNVETLAAVHWILENGGEAYSNIGKGRSTGTKLLSLDSFFNRPGLYEVEMGTPLSTVINELAGGFKVPVKAMHIGGPLGGLVPVTHIDKLGVDFESFQENGFLLGHASIICIPETFPLIHYIEHLLEFTAEESCGKCFPCRLGTYRGAEMFRKAKNEGYKMDRQLVDDLLHTLEAGSLCAHGGGIPLPIRNALEHFSSELNPYFA